MAEKRSNESLIDDSVAFKRVKTYLNTTLSPSEPNGIADLRTTSSLFGASTNNTTSNQDLFYLESYEIVWFNSNVDNPIRIDKLRRISDYIKVFDSIDSCRNHIEIVSSLSNKISIILVTYGCCSEQLIASLYHLSTISSIHCLITFENEENWTTNYPKVKVYTTLQSLLKALLIEIHQHLKYYDDHNMLNYSLHDTNPDKTTDNIEFWWSKVLNTIVHLPYSQECFQRFIATMKRQYEANTIELRALADFEQNYTSTQRNPIQEYTKDTFLYRLVNRILRQQNIRGLFLIGFFLRDLYFQLKSEHSVFRQKRSGRSKLTVYRAQTISKVEIEKLKDSTANFVTNCFFSTSLNSKMSEFYLGTSMLDDELQSILFEIDLNLNEESFPYADISAISWFPSESEILLMPGLEFRIVENSVHYDVHRQFWFAKLELKSDTIEKHNDKIVERFSERRSMKNYVGLLNEALTSFSQASTSQIEEVFNELTNLFPKEKWILAVRMYCLASYSIESDVNCNLGLKNYEEALKIWKELKDDDELNVDIDIGQIYFQIAAIYFLYLKDLHKAKVNYDLSINHNEIAIKNGLTKFEELNINESMIEIYGKKLTANVIEREIFRSDEVENENTSMIIKYTERYLESLLNCYPAHDKRIYIIAKQLSGHYEMCEMFDEQIRLFQRLIKLYEEDDEEDNSDKIIDMLEKIIAIYITEKNDAETAAVYQSTLEEYLTEDDESAYDDFSIDYRESDINDSHSSDKPERERRWSIP